MKCDYCMRDHSYDKWTGGVCPTCGAAMPAGPSEYVGPGQVWQHALQNCAYSAAALQRGAVAAQQNIHPYYVLVGATAASTQSQFQNMAGFQQWKGWFGYSGE